MFAVLHSDINSNKSVLCHSTNQPFFIKGRLVRVKDGIINLIIKNYLIDQYRDYLKKEIICFLQTKLKTEMKTEQF